MNVRTSLKPKALLRISEISYEDGQKYQIFFDQILGSGAQAPLLLSEASVFRVFRVFGF